MEDTEKSTKWAAGKGWCEWDSSRPDGTYLAAMVDDDEPPQNAERLLATCKREHATADPSDRALFELELRIARRADELANAEMLRRDQNLACWIRAEREVLSPSAGQS